MHTWQLGNDITINRLGYGAMQLTGTGVFGEVADRDNAKKVLQQAVELGVNFIDTAEAYGPKFNEALIADALYPYKPGLIIAGIICKRILFAEFHRLFLPVGLLLFCSRYSLS